MQRLSKTPMSKRRRPDAPVRYPTAYNSHDAIRLAPAAEPARAVRMNEPMAMPIDQVRKHLPAGVRGLNSVIAMGRYFVTGSQMICRVACKIA